MKVTIEHEEKVDYGYFNIFTQHEDQPYSKLIRESVAYTIGDNQEKHEAYERAKEFAKRLQEPKPVEVVFEIVDGRVTVESTEI